MAARGKALNETLAKSTLEAAKTLSEGEREITRGIGAKSAEVEETLRVRAEALTQTLSKLSTQITATLAGKLDEMTAALGGSVDRFRNQVVTPLQTLSNQFDAAVDIQGAAIHQSIVNGADEFAAKVTAQRDAVASKLEGAIESVDAVMAGRGQEIAGSLAARIEALHKLMEGPGADFITQLGAHGDQISNQISGVSERVGQTFEQRTSNLVALLTRRGDDLLAAINAAASGSVRSLGALTSQISGEVETSTTALRAAAEAAQSQSAETIHELLARLTSEVERSGASLREAVEQNAGASVTALHAAGDRMRNELSQVLDRLGQASLALDRIVEGAGDKLGAIEGDLGEKIDAMQRALGAMAAQVTELDRLSATTQQESGALVERMATHTSALADVARDLAAKQQTIDLALQHRHASLQTLFVDIDAKSREFDAAASHFAASFEESFNKAQTRAQEISAALATVTKGTALTVVGQFESIRENAGRERERTAQALQAAYEQANAQLSEVMNGNAERFRQSVAEVRQMASEVQRQLEATRLELRRGVFELPEETNEAANAMRRVVSDQIKALKELTAVVTASGADFDVAEPAAAGAPARFAATRNGEAVRIAEPQRDDDGRFLIAPPTAVEPPRPVAEPPRARAPQAPPPSTTPMPPLAAERGQSGWLSNLLAAASRDEGAQAPGRPGKDALGGISLDIAKFVDGEAAAEMWDRWRSGDTTAVSRRLYTAQGQQTFDDIRRRYRNDPQFQASVTRYTQEFERLLAKIGQTDRDGAQSRATLLSDAGKVYTMLAHASGRLG